VPLLLYPIGIGLTNYCFFPFLAFIFLQPA
jgi:hypothetical protein